MYTTTNRTNKQYCLQNDQLLQLFTIMTIMSCNTLLDISTTSFNPTISDPVLFIFIFVGKKLTTLSNVRVFYYEKTQIITSLK